MRVTDVSMRSLSNYIKRKIADGDSVFSIGICKVGDEMYVDDNSLNRVSFQICNRNVKKLREG